MNNFQPLEVVDRGSVTQLQVVENLITERSGRGVKKYSPLLLVLLGPHNVSN